MNDIGLYYDTEKDLFDLQIENGDLKFDSGLETAVIVSLFSDARVSDEQLPQGATFKRGWFGSKLSNIDQDNIGSRLWTLEREKVLPEVLRKYEDYCREALKWLIEDGIASSIKVQASFNASKQLLGVISIEEPAGATSRFQFLWDGQKIVRG